MPMLGKKVIQLHFSLLQSLRTSCAMVVREMKKRNGATILRDSLKALCSTIRKENSNATNSLTSAIWHASWSIMVKEGERMPIAEEFDFCFLPTLFDFLSCIST